MVPGATAFLCFCIVAIYSIDADESRKFKRDVVSGLVSFPRIGRGENVWKIGPPQMKRQSLVSFPRTGKRNPSDSTEELPDVLWLGPERKDAANNLWTLVHIKDFPILFSKAGKDTYGRRPEASEDTG
ncbi:UNVERIFIED_CONTAM: hypothetical protein PYX00_005705 [Menopon gallinae]|uniref:Uncharacterized protein n=1 Tax=Menopon gallinae TaxID=328185 RepID=A0AAW2HSD4_9NEOP